MSGIGDENGGNDEGRMGVEPEPTEDPSRMEKRGSSSSSVDVQATGFKSNQVNGGAFSLSEVDGVVFGREIVGDAAFVDEVECPSFSLGITQVDVLTSTMDEEEQADIGGINIVVDVAQQWELSGERKAGQGSGAMGFTSLPVDESIVSEDSGSDGIMCGDVSRCHAKGMKLRGDSSVEVVDLSTAEMPEAHAFGGHRIGVRQPVFMVENVVKIAGDGQFVEEVPEFAKLAGRGGENVNGQTIDSILLEISSDEESLDHVPLSLRMRLGRKKVEFKEGCNYSEKPNDGELSTVPFRGKSTTGRRLKRVTTVVKSSDDLGKVEKGKAILVSPTYIGNVPESTDRRTRNRKVISCVKKQRKGHTKLKSNQGGSEELLVRETLAGRKRIVHEGTSNEPTTKRNRGITVGEAGDGCGRYNRTCSPRQFVEVIEVIKKSEKLERAVQELGFGDLLSMRCRYLSKDLVDWLFEHCNPLDMTIRFGGNVVRMKVEDIRLVLGVPMGSIAIDKVVEDQSVREAFIEDWVRCSKGKKEGPTRTELDEAIKSDSEGGDRFKRNFLVFLVSRLLAPTNHGSSTTWRFLNKVSKLEDVRRMNWAAFTHQELGKAILKWKGNPTGQIGCTLFLQMFYIDRVVLLGKRFVPRTLPRIKSWDHEAVLKRIWEDKVHGGYGQGAVEDAYDRFEEEQVVKYGQMTNESDTVGFHVGKQLGADCTNEEVVEDKDDHNEQQVDCDGISMFEVEVKKLKEYGDVVKQSLMKFEDQMTNLRAFNPELAMDVDKDVVENTYVGYISSQLSQCSSQALDMIENISIAAWEMLEKLRENAGPKIAERNEQVVKDCLEGLNVDEFFNSDAGLVKGIGELIVGVTDNVLGHREMACLSEGHNSVVVRTPVTPVVELGKRKRYKSRALMSPFMQLMMDEPDTLQLHVDDAILVDYGLRKDLDPLEVLYDYGGLHQVVRKMFWTLDLGEAVDIEIIDAWCRVLNYRQSVEDENERLYLSPKMSAIIEDFDIGQRLSKVKRERNDKVKERFTASMKTWMKENRLKSLARYRMVFLPIYLRGHYFVACYDFERECVDVIDNLVDTFERRGEFEHQAHAVLTDFLRRTKHPRERRMSRFVWVEYHPSWKSGVPMSVRESNLKDCGVFTMVHMEKYLAGTDAVPDDLGEEKTLRFFRRTIGSEIIKDESNRVRHKIVDSARLQSQLE